MSKHLKEPDQKKLHVLMQMRMVKVGNGWEYKRGWSGHGIANVEGEPFTHNNVNNFRNKHYPRPTPNNRDNRVVVNRPQPITVVGNPPPKPDAVGAFWGRLDQIVLDVAENTKITRDIDAALALHRANMADEVADLREEILRTHKLVVALVTALGGIPQPK